MANAQRDKNIVTTMIGVSDLDGSTLLSVYANPTTNRMKVNDGASGSDLTGDNALRDANQITTLLAVSSDDGITPVPVYVSAVTNALLIKSV